MTVRPAPGVDLREEAPEVRPEPEPEAEGESATGESGREDAGEPCRRAELTSAVARLTLARRLGTLDPSATGESGIRGAGGLSIRVDTRLRGGKTRRWGAVALVEGAGAASAGTSTGSCSTTLCTARASA